MNKLFIVATLFLLSVTLLLAQDYKRFQQTPLRINAASELTVEPGMSQTGLIQSWQSLGWLNQPQRDEFWIKLLAKLDPNQKTIKAGVFEIRPGQTAIEALQQIQNGETQTYRFTIIEGWTFQRLREELRSQAHLEHRTANWSTQKLMQALGKPDVHPEGQFLPETYQYKHNDSDLKILQQAHQALHQILQEAWPQADNDLPLKSAYEALILASVIEKETARADERPLIAGVFINRLNKGMRLQTDPTVIYGLGSAFDGNLRRRDLRQDTPYNTYTRKGLPPTPIALPSQASIDAALHPQLTDKLYFVATGEQGRHYFSANLAEHEAAVKRYQLK